MAKSYGFTFEYVLNMSYCNLIMYNKIIPSFNSKDKGGKKEEKINADDPKNRNKVREILNG